MTTPVNDHSMTSQKRGGSSSSFLKDLVDTAKAWVSDNAMRLSAALTLYALLSLAPLLVFTVKIVGMLWRNKEGAREQIVSQMNNLMGFEASSVIQPILESGAKAQNGGVAAIISTLILLFSATGVFVELQDSMNTIWNVKPAEHAGIWGFVRHRLLSAGMVFGIAFLLLTSMFVSTLLSGTAKYIAGDSKVLVFTVDAVVSLFVVSLLFAGIFKFLPDRDVRWRWVWRGALLSGIMFTLGKYGLALYFKYASPTSAFGAAGTLAAVMIWVYYSSFILFFGAEFTKIQGKLDDPLPSPADEIR